MRHVSPTWTRTTFILNPPISALTSITLPAIRRSSGFQKAFTSR